MPTPSDAHRTIKMKQASSGAILLDDVQLEDGSVVASSGTFLDTHLITDLRDQGITRVRIKSSPDGAKQDQPTRDFMINCVKTALKEVVKRFRHVDLQDPHTKALFHACALSRAREKLRENVS
ncbi:MAG: hypothetical protein PF961_07330 [Planctomycetota bacterium]|jgi:hypothetical protein|nr:hypothetical protein [Planctomycetota bacterium]